MSSPQNGQNALADNTATNYSQGRAVRYVANELLLKFHRGVTAVEVDQVLEKYGLVRLLDQGGLAKIGYCKVQIPDGQEPEKLFQEIQLQERVLLKTVEPNFVAATLAVADPRYGEQWYVEDAKFDLAWPVLAGTNKVVVAVVDTGVEADHSDLVGNTVVGKNFVAGNFDTSDDHGHGTFVAGIIAAAWNDQGIRGLCPNAVILPVKALDSDGSGTYENVAEGIIYAADSGAKVINLSIGGYAYSFVLKDAVDYALEKGCVLVAAAGNDGTETVMYPAGYPDVIAVGALDANGQSLPLSNKGSHISVVAPGDAILSTTLNGQYTTASGSSPAAAIVSSLAALLASERIDCSAVVLRQILCQSAEDLGETGRDSIYGYGKVDAQAALGKEVSRFHDVAVRSIDIEPQEFSTNKPTYIVVAIENAGSYPAETCDVVVYLKSETGRVEIGRQDDVTVSAKQNVAFEWIPDAEETNLVFEAQAICIDDENIANDSFTGQNYRLQVVDGLYVLYAVDPPMHQWIAYQAYGKLPAGTLKSELANYIPSASSYYANNWTADVNNPDWNWLYSEPSADSDALIEGAWEEDKGLRPDGGVLAYRFLEHFWYPESTFDDGLFANRSALQKAQDCFRSATNIYSVNPRVAYYWLGRTAHLIADMSVPAHVHGDVHGAWYLEPDDPYETFTKDNGTFRNITSSSANTTIPDYNELTEPLFSGMPEWYDHMLNRLFLDLAECADDFDSGTEGHGDSPPDKVVGLPNYHDDYLVQQQQLEARAIGYVAALYRLFWERTHPAIQVTVSAFPPGQGLQIVVDGTTYTESQTFTWEQGASHTIEAPLSQSGYTFSYWSDGLGRSHSVAPTNKQDYVATFTRSGGESITLTSSVDTFVDATAPTVSYGTAIAMFCDTSPSYSSLLRFDLSSIPAGSTVDSASLQLYGQSGGYSGVWLRRVTSTWTNSTTWNTQPTYNNTPAISRKDITSTSWGFYTWTSAEDDNLRSFVQTWVNNSSQNYGFHITADLDTATFRTRDTATASQRPQLTVNYTPPPTGTLTVYINPADARTQGAQWKLTSGPDTSYQDSGDTIPGIPAGSYTLSFKSISGWSRPSSHNSTITVNASGNTRIDTYGFNVSAPTGVAATDGLYTDKINVTWSASAGATSYEVWRNTSSDSGGATRIGNYVAETAYDDFFATSGQTYYYWITAKNSVDTTGFSSSDSGYIQTTIEPVSVPAFSPDGGAYAGNIVSVTVSCATAEATIRYTTDGNEPTEASSTVVSGGAVTVPVPGTLKAKAWKSGMSTSATKTAAYSSKASGEVLFEDFESYTENQWASPNWVADANALDGANNYVGFGPAGNTSKVLRLYGAPGSCWGAITYRPVTFPTRFYLECDVFNSTDIGTGCHPDRGGIGMRNGTSWMNPSRGLLDFLGNGTVRGNGEVIGTYEAGRWYHVKIRYDRQGSQLTLTYWLDGILLKQIATTIADTGAEDSLNHVEFAAQEYAALFDNLQILSAEWDDGYQSIGGGWRRLTWFGDYVPMGTDGWIWHNQHGFFFVPTASTSADLWLYAMDMGWLYTGNTLYPFIYRSSPAAWLWYNGSTNPRWFMNMTANTWESRP